MYKTGQDSFILQITYITFMLYYICDKLKSGLQLVYFACNFVYIFCIYIFIVFYSLVFWHFLFFMYRLGTINCVCRKIPVMGCTNCNPWWGTFKSPCYQQLELKLTSIQCFSVLLFSLPYMSLLCKITRFVKDGSVILKRIEITSVQKRIVSLVGESWCNNN